MVSILRLFGRNTVQRSPPHLFLVQTKFSRRIIKLIGLLIAATFFVFGLWSWAISIGLTRSILVQLHVLPPTYSSYHLQELALPQHDPSLAHPEGHNGKFIWFSSHVWGWGNVLQEHLLHGLLAYNAKRAFVSNNYTWSNDNSLYSKYNGKRIPSRIPMSVMIDGPLAGGLFATSDNSPRMVLKEYFDKICPNPKVLDGDLLKADLPYEYSALTVMNAWVKLLAESENCLEVNQTIFDPFIFGSQRVIDIVPSLLQSPLMKLFRWSPLITDGFRRNSALFVSPRAVNIPSPTEEDPYPVIPGLLVLHVRRGDFEGHCHHLHRWGSTWTGFNQLPEVLDRFETQSKDADGHWTEESKSYYQRTCYPSIEQMVNKVHDIRYHTDAGRGLRNIYIMTNGDREWVKQLKVRLRKIGTWDSVSSSRDLSLTWEQTYVKHAVDALIAQRADIFVGNGFSSLTGNVVLFRIANGLGGWNTRLW